MRCDFEVEVRSGGAAGVYEVAVDSPAGSATGELRLDVSELLARRRELAASVLASAVTSRSSLPSLERPVREVGSTLFRSLFVDRIYGRYAASLQVSAREQEPLRVVLRLRAPELAALPWEALFDAESEEYLCQREPLVRYVEAAQATTPLTVEAPLRILGLVAAPRNLPSLDVAEERRRLGNALRGFSEQGLIELVWAHVGTWSELQELLQAGPWHVVHFIGHGGTDSSGGGVLALEDEDTGHAAHVSARRFARLLHASRPVPRLVVLNACSSGESAADDLLSSTAASIVHSGISAAVAMQFAVSDPAALAFARGFYRALGLNAPVDEAVRLGRIAIDGTSEQTLEWVTPVLYLRTAETRLFDVESLRSDTMSTQEQPRGTEVAREATLYGLYVQAMAAIRTEQYQEAVALLDSLLTLDPDYRDATERRASADRRRRLAIDYARGREAEDAGDWDQARRAYADVIGLDGSYRDALARHEGCRRHQELVSLQDELRLHAAAGRWQAVLSVSEHLRELDPAAADPERLATRAREELAGREAGPREEPAQQPSPPPVTSVTPAAASAPRQPPARPQPLHPPAPPRSDSDGRRGGRSRVLWVSLAGLLVVVAVSVLVAVLPDDDDPGRGSESVSVATPSVGSCRELVQSDLPKESNDSEAVDCSQTHNAETFLVGSFAGSSVTDTADQAAMDRHVSTSCRKGLADYVGASESVVLRSFITWIYFRPSDAQWRDGARWYRCDVVRGRAGAEGLEPLPVTMRSFLSTRRGDDWALCIRGAFDKLDRIPCSMSHTWRASSTAPLGEPEEAYPGNGELVKKASARCGVVASPTTKNFTYPDTKAAWDNGLRHATCFTRTGK